MGLGRAVPRGRCVLPRGDPFNNVDARAKWSGPRAPGPAWATHQSWGAGELGAGEHLALFGAARLEDLGDKRLGLLSRFLSAEAKRLKVKCPPRARPSTQVPRAPVHAVSSGPVPSEATAE